MKNFTTRCPIEGSSALQPEFVRAPVGTIVVFPGCDNVRGAHAAPASRRSHRPLEAACVAGRYALDTEMVRSLRYGTARGAAYERVKPWQAVLVGIAFSAFAFVCLSLGL